MVRKHRSEVVSVESRIPGTYTVAFSPSGKSFRYSPGQFLHLALDSGYDGSGQWPESRCFSMQSSPDEENIRITYAVKGRFTQMMEQQLKAGCEVWLKLPYGDLFTRQHNKSGTVFIAGGTGITPFLSLFNHTSFKEYADPHIYLGFRSAEYNIYDRELNSVQHYAPEIFHENVDGPLNIRNIFSENGKDCDYFIFGPPAMIKSFKNQLVSMGVPPGQVHSDDWE
mgnify:FL=1